MFIKVIISWIFLYEAKVWCQVDNHCSPYIYKEISVTICKDSQITAKWSKSYHWVLSGCFVGGRGWGSFARGCCVRGGGGGVIGGDFVLKSILPVCYVIFVDQST